jgi:DNA-binding response OmpR family regulator
MPKILLVGQDVRLLETRSAVLKRTGAEVVYCVGCQVFDVVALESPDLVVLCHSLPEVEAEMIADKVHACSPRTMVLLVVSLVSEDRQNKNAKFSATSLPDPEKLLRQVTELLDGLPHHSGREITNGRLRPAIL